MVGIFVLRVRTMGRLAVAAASGIVSDGRRLYVLADDELSLAVHDLDRGPLPERIPLLPGELPISHRERKREKPDLEALTWLDGRLLLALGSGSRPTRERGVIVEVDAGGAAAHPARTVTLAPLYLALREHVQDLNIEGAAVAGSALRLLQRGNGRSRQNAIFDLDLDGIVRAARSGDPLRGTAVRRFLAVDLGSLDGVPLGFTDASPIGEGRVAFAAAAEASPDTYEDGPCAGSVVGILGADGRLERFERLETTAKVEGIDARWTAAGDLELLLVADADDPTVLAPLLAATLPAR